MIPVTRWILEQKGPIAADGGPHRNRGRNVTEPTDLADSGDHEALISKLYAEQCASEPIHQLGTIQPHGYLTVICLSDRSICQVSSGIGRHYPGLLEPERILDQPAEAWMQPAEGTFDDLLASLDFNDRTEIRIRRRKLAADGALADWEPELETECTGYLINGFAVLEWITVAYEASDILRHLQATESFTKRIAEPIDAPSLEEFLQECAEKMQDFSGYERVMVYRFLPDWSGEIMAEATQEGTPVRFLGQRFPASDIPPQARELYLRNRLRVLADINAVPDSLIPEHLPDGRVLDQSLGLLRSMSRAHMSYLKNMCVESTLTISIIVDNELWGMIACHHNDRLVPPDHVVQTMRSASELLSRVISSRASELIASIFSDRASELRRILDAFYEQLSSSASLESTFREVGLELCRLLGASDAGIYANGGLATTFDIEPRAKKDFIRSLRDKAGSLSKGESLCWDKLPAAIGACAGLPPGVAGLMLTSLDDGTEDFLFWLRSELVREVHWAGKPGKFVLDKHEDKIRLEPRRSFEIWKETQRDRSESWIEEDRKLARIAGMRFSEFLSDLTAIRLQLSLEWAADHDAVTHLLNRTALQDALREHLREGPTAVLLIDLDGFKEINAGMGHDIGDMLLKEVAHRVTSAASQNDVVGRFGDNEFLVIRPLSSEGAGAEETQRLIDCLLQSLHEPISVGRAQIELAVSIGAAIAPLHCGNVDGLTQRAAHALSESRKKDGVQAVVFSTDLEQAFQTKLQLEGDVHAAIERKEFVLFYQPQIDLQRNRVIGCEALIRWQHPERGLLPPGTFMPQAEQGRAIHDIGRWVINEAVRQRAAWSHRFGDEFVLSFNVSFAQVQDRTLVEEIRKAVDRHSVCPAGLQVELTESAMLGHEDQCRQVTEQLRAMGVGVALDDFGTGFSSLSHIHRLELDCIKIDCSFVRQLERDHQARAVVRSLLSLARDLDLGIVAEGVENAAVANWLRQSGCGLAQGFFWSQAVRSEDFPEVVERVDGGGLRPD